MRRMMKVMLMLWSAAPLVVTHRVEMSNASLTRFPSIDPGNATYLNLSHNSIAMGDSDIRALQQYGMIRQLDLSYNLIRTLPAGALSPLSGLETLDLRGNKLQTLEGDVFKGLEKLRRVSLEENPWSCSCALTLLLTRLRQSGVSAGDGVSCQTPQNSDVYDVSLFCPGQASTPNTSMEISTTANPLTERSSSTAAALRGSTLSSADLNVNGSSKHLVSAGAGSQSWSFLLGVVVLALSTSLLIVCAVKSPSWYKLLFNYRHQRLREEADPGVFPGVSSSGRVSTFSLDTEQTDAQELELQADFEDDDGFIEDVYIEPGSYSQSTDAEEL